MTHEPWKTGDRLLGGVLGLIVVLIVLAYVLPAIFGYLVALGVLAIVGRVVWFLTRP